MKSAVSSRWLPAPFQLTDIRLAAVAARAVDEDGRRGGVTVYAVANPVKPEIIKNYLQSEGIHCLLEGINQAAEPRPIAS